LVEDDNIDNIRTFYSCLYRLLLFPRKFYEINKEEEIVHYSPYNGKVLPGYMFTDNGFWDTFRAVFPFFNLMYPELNKQIMEGLANTYKESGWLPEWASPGHRDIMIGSNSAPIISDAYLKGNVNKNDEEVLLEAILKNANINEGRPAKSVGREGVDYYNRLGYVPYDVGINENAARTLEYAYADFTIAEMAKKMNKPVISKRFYKQSKNYKNLFDPETKWMRGKNKDGTFQSPFNPLKWGDAFTEGNSLHYSWSVFHDIQGLIDLMGGNSEFTKMLDKVFTMPPKFDDSYYGFTIHEIREMQIANMGNYAHGNQPVQHMIYLYNYAKQPWKAQNKVREVMKKLYSATPDGYCGDEDNGQTSAWYVFSSLGFYPVTPGVPQYVFGSPLFEKVTMNLQNGNTFTINAKNNNYNNHYINSLKLNGANYNKTWIDYNDIQKGGNLNFEMNSVPNKEFGISNVSSPYSMTKNN
jgi:predicted alpha-1,2-mannosidase